MNKVSLHYSPKWFCQHTVSYKTHLMKPLYYLTSCPASQALSILIKQIKNSVVVSSTGCLHTIFCFSQVAKKEEKQKQDCVSRQESLKFFVWKQGSGCSTLFSLVTL